MMGLLPYHFQEYYDPQKDSYYKKQDYDPQVRDQK